MRHGVAKRALGVALASSLVVTAVDFSSWNWKNTETALAAGSNAIYVDDAAYYNDAYDEQYAYNGDDLGATYSKEKTVFKVWSPEAESMTLNLYTTGSDKEEGAAKKGSYSMKKADKGVWEYTYEGDLNGVYYTYRAVIEGLAYDEAVDPYAKAVGVNGDRGMVVDLDSTDPSNWDADYNSKRTATKLSDIVVWEVHIRDFSIDVSSGVSAENRGKYKAFTETDTTVNGEGKIASCVNYLKKMGVTHVQLMPTYDYGSVDETAVSSSKSEDNYNWGYDPKNYNAPEGSYSSNPYDGATRITEMKQMIQALHDAGIKVVMDVVYNHTYDTATSNFNKLMPDYYYKITTDSAGNVVYNDESGCGNATRSEGAMYDKFMRDSLKYWVDEYHIDGFRFDLMGIHSSKTMNHIREDLDKTFGEDTIVMYGEGWTGGGYSENSAYKEYCRDLDDGIGYFNDQIRDAVKGEADKTSQIGLVQQNMGITDLSTDAEKYPTSVFGGIMGSVGKNTSNWWMWRAYWSDTSNRVLSYDSCHDNTTLWDKLAKSTGETYDSTSNSMINMSRLTAGYLLTSHGGTFLHAGEEFARSKAGDHNSYKSGDLVNALDWTRISNYARLTNYYQGMIEIRKAFDGFRTVYEEKDNATLVEENTASGFFNTDNVKECNLTPISEFIDVSGSSTSDAVVNSIGYYLSNTTAGQWNQVAVLLNNTLSSKEISLTAADGSTQWVLVSNGKEASVEGISTTTSNTVLVPGKSVVVAVPKTTFDQANIKAVADDVVTGLDSEIVDPVEKENVTPAPQDTQFAIKELKLTPQDGQLVGKSVKMTATAQYGEGNCQYRFFIYRGDRLVKSSAWGSADSYTWKPSSAGSYTIKVAVRDEAKNEEYLEKTYVVAKKLSVGSFKASSTSVKKGKSITFSAKASGGFRTYKYSFKVTNAAGKKVKSRGYSTKNTYTWKTTDKGTYKVTVTIKDKKGTTATKTLKKIKVK